MKTFQKLYLCVFALVLSCSNESDVAPVSAQDKAIAMIAGVTFTSTNSKVTDTGAGFYFSLKDNNGTEIAFFLNDTKPGTYSALYYADETDPPLKKAIASVFLSGSLYSASSGSITFTTGTDSKLSGDYYFSAADLQGNSTSIESGHFQDMPILKPPTDRCLITKIVPNSSISSEFSNYYYDSEGHLQRILAFNSSYPQGNTVSYFWGGNQIVRIRHQTELKYQNGKLIQSKIYALPLTGAGSTYDFSYDANGRLVKYGGIDFSYNNDGNVINSASGQLQYSNFDSNKSPFLLLAQGLNLSFLYPIEPSVYPPLPGRDAFYLSQNNISQWTYSLEAPGYVFHTTYKYNSNSYPTELNSFYTYGTKTGSVTKMLINYSCN